MRLHVLLLGLLLSAVIVFAWRSFKVVFTSFPHEVNKALVDLKFEILNSTTTGDTELSCRVNVIEQMDDIRLRYELSLDTGDQNYTVLLNRSVNFCQFLKTKSIDPIMKMIYDDLSKYGNFFKSCPIKKGIYYIHEYKVDEEMLPSYVPEANLFLNLLLTLKNQVRIFNGTLHLKIDKSKGFNNLKMFSLG